MNKSDYCLEIFKDKNKLTIEELIHELKERFNIVASKHDIYNWTLPLRIKGIVENCGLKTYRLHKDLKVNKREQT